jgi:hypothetical protein
MIFSFRLPIAALAVMALAAQNPLALAGDPYIGTFQNEQLKLDLTRTAAEYSGVILLNGQSLPVKAKAAAGKLTGTFESQGKTYAFEAARSGSQLSVTTDGVTHVLEKAGAGPAPAPAPGPAPGPAPAVVGEWQSESNVVRINADGSAAIGDKAYKWSLEGDAITFASSSGESIKVPFEMAGNIWTWKFPQGRMALTRIAAGSAATTDKGIIGSWQGPPGKVQLNLDGTATVAGVSYRYTRADNQLTLTGPDGTFVATVQQTGDSMNWTVNGKTLAFQREAPTWAVGGGTGAGGILPDLVGKWCQANDLNNSNGNFSRSVCFTLLADGSFLYANDFGANGQLVGGPFGAASGAGDTGTWTATEDAITSTTKKTGARTFRMQKRNHPKSGHPMLVLDGTEFTAAYKRAPWR